MKTLIKLAAGTSAALALAGTAQAGCGGGLYCGSSTGTSSLPPLSSYFGGSSGSYASGSSHSSYGGSLSAYEASARYGSGSISSTYSDGGYTGSGVELAYGGSTYGFSGPAATAPGLGAGESLQATSCPVSVHNPEGARVLGCYNVVKKVVTPVATTSYYRVVRPVVYVRYPVPVPVPYTVYSPCASSVYYSRYGGYGPQGGYGGRCW